MNRKLFSAIFSVLISSLVSSQTPIDVTEQTIKIGALSETELIYGFAQGDQIVFNFNEVNGKELKELHILDFPGTLKFSDFKAKKIENKVFNVDEKSIYRFKFYNSALSGRICKIKIQRIPKEEKFINFNTAIKWIVKQDTTWNVYTENILIKQDSIKIPGIRKVLASEEIREEIILDKVQRVHSTTNENGNKTAVFFTLPNNTLTNYESKNVIAWAYWVGVNEESNIAWKNNQRTISTTVKSIAGLTTSPLGALALGAVTDLALPSTGEDVAYGLVDETNKDLFFSGKQYRGFDFGKGIGGYKSFTNQNVLQGKYYIVLSNDNLMQGIDANIKVSAIVEHKKFKDEKYTEYKITPIYEKKILKEPIIKTTKIPVNFDSE
ncbi:hypothetical protein NAT51_03045 [Flavobacterium amniphilum]|uniref:hypothetical protein n=1 Tax=Flavobacterium amniphilum TaxID=1834035 RepID=UPI00202A53C4|nr:hypothetical protein [Flavobacterium amniphilum]MCL9804481.1 hypothetical protein [Flavobacterium amniphilum]